MNRALACACLWLAITPTVGLTAPLGDYESRLRAAITSLRSAPSQGREEALNRLQGLLPSREDVSLSDYTIKVNNRWVHESIDAYFSEPDAAKREAIFLRIEQRLGALLDHVAEAHPGQPDQGARGHLAVILSRHEFQHHDTVTWWDRVGAWLQDMLARFVKLFPHPQREKGLAATILQTLFWLLAGAVTFFLIRRGFRFSRRETALASAGSQIIPGTAIERHAAPGQLGRMARALAERGEYRAAVRAFYLSLLYELEAHGHLSLSAAATNQDYLRATQPLGAVHASLAALTRQFDRVWYGKLKPSESEYRGFLEHYQTALESLKNR